MVWLGSDTLNVTKRWAGLRSSSVGMTSLVCPARAVRMRAVGRQIDHLPVAHAAFGNDVVGEFPHVGPASFEHRHLHAALVVQVNVQRRLRQIMVIVEVAGKPLRQFALLVVVYVDERGKTLLRPRDLRRALLQAGSCQIAYCFGAIGVAPRRHMTLEFRYEIVVDGDGNALHVCLSHWARYADLLTSSYPPIDL
jgi:hypothetical protein